jgi:hyperosmotically inducible protein
MALCLGAVCASLASTALAGGGDEAKAVVVQPALSNKDADRDIQSVRIGELVRHELLMLPYYGMFDWLEAEVQANDTVVLRGQVTQPMLRSDAEKRVSRIESVAKVVNEIEVLPLSQADDQIRLQTQRAMLRFESPLFRYGTQPVSPIHVIVKNGRVTLKGVVARDMDRRLAYMAARSVSGVFEVRNELTVEKS